MKKKPDIIIAKIRKDYAENSLYAAIREEDVAALLELKFTSDAPLSTANGMKDDVRKLRRI